MSDLNNITYVQAEIQAAEKRIEQELERIASLGQFRELWCDIKIQTSRVLNSVERVEKVDVKIRAVL
ncbi:hypothetical protein [Piscinibacter defluvii]|uniref:hypothetical protein n=1 Tax=Piscinibacter defluvii TaxID=1796922 RepID=UPI000FDF311B|nr:hypothetical protein [Piscinibacter defluvii]